MSKMIKIGSVFFKEQHLEFEPFIKKIDDSFKSDWNQQYVLGRMDAVATFQRTRRTISLSFDVPSKGLNDAIFKRKQLQLLSSFLYPSYRIEGVTKTDAKPQIFPELKENETPKQTKDKAKKQNQILAQQGSSKQAKSGVFSGSPLIHIQFANLIESEDGGPLYGYVDSFSINPYEDMGFFVEDDKIYPKSYSVDLRFNVIHTNPVGWDLKGFTRTGGIYKMGD